MSRPFTPTVHRLDDRITPATVGGVDPAFAGGTLLSHVGTGDIFFATAVQTDGNIVFAGTTDPTNDSNLGQMLITRHRPDGSVDTTFGTGGFANVDLAGREVATAIAIRPDGKIVVAGYTEQEEVLSNIVVVRLNADGSRDATFGTDGVAVFDLGGDDRAHALALASEGRVVVAGATGADMVAVRLEASGALDKSFDLDGIKALDLGGTDVAHAVVLTPDGRVVLAGSTGGNLAAVRLAADGSAVDFGFGNVLVNGTKAAVFDFGGHDQAYAAALRPDGKLVLAGIAGSRGDMTAVRLNPDGTADATFNGNGVRHVVFGGPSEARALALQADGRVVLVGIGSNVTDPLALIAAESAIARLNENGSDDPSFPAHTLGFGTTVTRGFATALDAQGHILVAGQHGVDAAAVRILGRIGAPGLLLVAGTANGSARQYVLENGSYTPGPDFTVLPGYTGPVRVAAFDLTGDGLPERVAGIGPGGGPQVIVYDGADGRLLANFFAFEATFTGGVLVAGGDLTGDGRAELVVSADDGGGPRVRIFEANSVAAGDPRSIADFFAIDDVNFRGGARTALGDVNADGTLDLVVGAGPGGGPRVALFDGKTLTGTPTRLIGDFFVFESGLRNGAFPAVGDLDADGHGDLFFGAGPGGAPRIRAISGKSILDEVHIATIDDAPGLDLATFFAGDPGSRRGVTVAIRDVDGDARADLVTGSGPGLNSEVLVFTGAGMLTAPNDPDPLQILDPFDAVIPGGVFIG